MNFCVLSGYLAEDPKPLGGDKGPVVMRLSVGRRRKDPETQEYKNFYESHDLKVWGEDRKLAAGLTSGQKIMVTGRLERESYTKKDSEEKVYKTVVVCDNLSTVLEIPKEDTQETDNFF